MSGSRKTKRVTYSHEHKVKIWEGMETAYFREGIVALSNIRQQRDTVTEQLNLC